MNISQSEHMSSPSMSEHTIRMPRNSMTMEMKAFPTTARSVLKMRGNLRSFSIFIILRKRMTFANCKT